MNFGQAVEALKQGQDVRRAGWNGKGMWLRLVQPPQSASPSDTFYEVSVEYCPVPGKLLPWIGMKTADNCFVPWLASQTDILSEDWEIADD